MPENSSVRIFVVTYKRPVLLKRALMSLINQSHQNWKAEILNDEPADLSVNNLIVEIGDARIGLCENPQKRGGTGNFNYAFSKKISEEFAAILEDDNWFEPGFLAEMLENLKNYPTVKLAIANENIWEEKPNGEWLDLKRTIWPVSGSNYLFDFNAEQKCLGAKICNSSMLWRTGNFNWLTPAEIPIDVTEHFRERIIPHPILIISKPLVNFAVTRHTHRDSNGEWSVYQALLIASVFENINATERINLAKKLWARARNNDKFLGTALMNAALVSGAAKPLFQHSTPKERLHYLLTTLKRFNTFIKCLKAKQTKSQSWQFLRLNWNSGTQI